GDFLLAQDRLGLNVCRRVELVGDLALNDLFDRQFEVASSATINQRTSPVHQLDQAALDQRAQLETPANAVDNLFALERFDHFDWLLFVCVRALLCPLNRGTSMLGSVFAIDNPWGSPKRTVQNTRIFACLLGGKSARAYTRLTP